MKKVFIKKFNEMLYHFEDDIVSTDDIIEYITDIEDEGDVPDYFFELMKKRDLKFKLTKLSVKEIMEKDEDVREYILSDYRRYDDDHDGGLDNPILIVDDEVYDGYSRLQWHYKNGEDVIYGYVNV